LPLASLLLLTWGLPLLVVAPRHRQKVLHIFINLFTAQDTGFSCFTDGAPTLVQRRRHYDCFAGDRRDRGSETVPVITPILSLRHMPGMSMNKNCEHMNENIRRLLSEISELEEELATVMNEQQQ